MRSRRRKDGIKKYRAFSYPFLHRPMRFALCTILFILITVISCEKEPDISTVAESPTYTGTIVAFGDSLTEGLGVSETAAYPAQLEKRLIAGGNPYRVINAGISGETSSGALSRIKWVLTLKPDILILETGANDGLRGIDPLLIEKNIREIVKILKNKSVIVILAGMRVVENMGPDYTTAFAKIFPNIAADEGLIFIPFFLKGVADNPALNQSDGIHPTAEGYRIITDLVYPYVLDAIRIRPATP
jgi:acyl-CoA thioesterase I